MKQSEINAAYLEAKAAFEANGWALPPKPKWDITDFGLGDFARYGLVLINLTEEPEYCEKLMYARKNQFTPMHSHQKKKEDIICRSGKLAIEVWKGVPNSDHPRTCFTLQRNGESVTIQSGDILVLQAGERVTLVPGIYHEFRGADGPVIIGEVSTANDDLNDNLFINPDIGRFSSIEENARPAVQLVSQEPER